MSLKKFTCVCCGADGHKGGRWVGKRKQRPEDKPPAWYCPNRDCLVAADRAALVLYAQEPENVARLHECFGIGQPAGAA